MGAAMASGKVDDAVDAHGAIIMIIRYSCTCPAAATYKQKIVIYLSVRGHWEEFVWTIGKSSWKDEAIIFYLWKKKKNANKRTEYKSEVTFKMSIYVPKSMQQYILNIEFI